jgi:hypothetical protein
MRRRRQLQQRQWHGRRPLLALRPLTASPSAIELSPPYHTLFEINAPHDASGLLPSCCEAGSLAAVYAS